MRNIGISIYANGTVGRTSFDQPTINAMVGQGGLVRPEREQLEIDRRVNIDLMPLALAQNFIGVLVRGGLPTEQAAMDLLQQVADMTVEHQKGVGWRSVQRVLVDNDLLPAEIRVPGRVFRGACEWDATAQTVVVNMVKARNIHMGHIRERRDAELGKLDILSLRALEAVDLPEQQRIQQLKQTLRDIPQTFNLSGYTTPDTLRTAWPAILPPWQ